MNNKSEEGESNLLQPLTPASVVRLHAHHPWQIRSEAKIWPDSRDGEVRDWIQWLVDVTGFGWFQIPHTRKDVMSYYTNDDSLESRCMAITKATTTQWNPHKNWNMQGISRTNSLQWNHTLNNPGLSTLWTSADVIIVCYITICQ